MLGPTVAPMAKQTYKRGTKVWAADDLPGVPAGTRGKVLVTVGLSWLRLRIRFDNGVELGNLDPSQVSLEAAA